LSKETLSRRDQFAINIFLTMLNSPASQGQTLGKIALMSVNTTDMFIEVLDKEPEKESKIKVTR
jgi:hypothetical protein